MQKLESSILNLADIGPLKLFVDGQGHHARAVEQDIRRVLHEELGDDNTLEVVNVVAHPGVAEENNISQTPSLVYYGLEFKRRLIGNVELRDRILSLTGREPIARRYPTRDLNRTFADLAPDGMVLVDENGQIIRCNHAARMMLGLSGHSVHRQVFGFPLVEGPATQVTLGNGRPVELRVKAVAWRGVMARLATMRALDCIGPSQVSDLPEVDAREFRRITSKITTLQKLVEQTSKAIDDMHATAQKLEKSNQDLSAFAYRAAHDILSPLKSVKSGITLALADDRAHLSGDGQKLLDAANERAGRVIALTEALLDFSRISDDAVKQVDVNLDTVLQWVLDDLAPQLDDAQAICTVSPLPLALGVTAHYYQVFLNLFTNSIKYRRQGIPLQISVTSEYCNEDKSNPKVDIHVQDNGSGFDQKHAEQIFDPFKRLMTGDEIAGSGIGLATVKRITTLHGGGISAKGTPGVGACFTVRLPLLQPHMQQLQATRD